MTRKSSNPTYSKDHTEYSGHVYVKPIELSKIRKGMTSLPPGIVGAVQGELELTIVGPTDLTEYGGTYIKENIPLAARISWLGNTSEGILVPIMRKSHFKNDSAQVISQLKCVKNDESDPNSTLYPIICGNRGLARYLEDMQYLPIEICDASSLHIIGCASLHLRDISLPVTSNVPLFEAKNGKQLLGTLAVELVARFGSDSKLVVAQYFESENTHTGDDRSTECGSQVTDSQNNVTVEDIFPRKYSPRPSLQDSRSKDEDLHNLNVSPTSFSPPISIVNETNKKCNIRDVGNPLSVLGTLLERGKRLRYQMDKSQNGIILSGKENTTRESYISNNGTSVGSCSVGVTFSDIASQCSLPTSTLGSPTITSQITVPAISEECVYEDEKNKSLSSRWNSPDTDRTSRFPASKKTYFPSAHVPPYSEFQTDMKTPTETFNMQLLTEPLLLEDQKVKPVSNKLDTLLPLATLGSDISSELVRVYAVSMNMPSIVFAGVLGGEECVGHGWRIKYEIPTTSANGIQNTTTIEVQIANFEPKTHSVELNHNSVYPLLFDHDMAKTWREGILQFQLWHEETLVADGEVTLRQVLFSSSMSLQCMVPLIGKPGSKIPRRHRVEPKEEHGSRFRLRGGGRYTRQRRLKKEKKTLKPIGIKNDKTILASIEITLHLQQQPCGILPTSVVAQMHGVPLSLESYISKTSSCHSKKYSHKEVTCPTHSTQLVQLPKSIQTYTQNKNIQRLVHLHVHADWASECLVGDWMSLNLKKNCVTLRIRYRSFADPPKSVVDNYETARERSYEIIGQHRNACFVFTDAIREPLVLTPKLLRYLCDHHLMLEVWAVCAAGLAPGSDQEWAFVGLCKIPLHRMYDSYKVNNTNDNLVVALDGIVNVTDPISGESRGTVRLCVASGSQASLELMGLQRGAAIIIQRFIRTYISSLLKSRKSNTCKQIAFSSNDPEISNRSRMNLSKRMHGSAKKNNKKMTEIHFGNDRNDLEVLSESNIDYHDKGKNISKHTCQLQNISSSTLPVKDVVGNRNDTASPTNEHVFMFEIVGSCLHSKSKNQIHSGSDTDWGFYVEYAWPNENDKHLLWWDCNASLNTRTRHEIYQYPISNISSSLKFSLLAGSTNSQSNNQSIVKLGQAVLQDFKVKDFLQKANKLGTAEQIFEVTIIWNDDATQSISSNFCATQLPETLHLRFCYQCLMKGGESTTDCQTLNAEIRDESSSRKKKMNKPYIDPISDPSSILQAEDLCESSKKQISVISPMSERLLPTNTTMLIHLREARNLDKICLQPNNLLYKDQCFKVAVRFAFFTGGFGFDSVSMRHGVNVGLCDGWIARETLQSSPSWNPVWDWHEDIPVKIDPSLVEYIQNCDIRFEVVMRSNVPGNDTGDNVVGCCNVPLNHTLMDRNGIQGWFPINSLHGTGNCGELNVSICFTHYQSDSNYKFSAVHSTTDSLPSKSGVNFIEESSVKSERNTSKSPTTLSDSPSLKRNEDTQRKSPVTANDIIDFLSVCDNDSTVLFHPHGRNKRKSDTNTTTTKSKQESNSNHHLKQSVSFSKSTLEDSIVTREMATAEAQALFGEETSTVIHNDLSSMSYSLNNIDRLLGNSDNTMKYLHNDPNTKIFPENNLSSKDVKCDLQMDASRNNTNTLYKPNKLNANEKTFMLKNKLLSNLGDLDRMMEGFNENKQHPAIYTENCNASTVDKQKVISHEEFSNASDSEVCNVMQTNTVELTGKEEINIIKSVEKECYHTDEQVESIPMINSVKSSGFRETPTIESIISGLNGICNRLQSESSDFDPSNVSFLLDPTSNDASFAIVLQDTSKPTYNGNDSFVNDAEHNSWLEWASQEHEKSSAAKMIQRAWSSYMKKTNDRKILRSHETKLASTDIYSKEINFSYNTNHCMNDSMRTKEKVYINTKLKSLKVKNNESSFALLDSKTQRIARILRG